MVINNNNNIIPAVRSACITSGYVTASEMLVARNLSRVGKQMQIYYCHIFVYLNMINALIIQFFRHNSVAFSRRHLGAVRGERSGHAKASLRFSRISHRDLLKSM